MEWSKKEERVVNRFERVLRFFWDGIPTPPFADDSSGAARLTFLLRQLAYSPDYYGSVSIMSLAEDETAKADDGACYTPLHVFAASSLSSSTSARIGSHYSPMVGVFSFAGRRRRAAALLAAVREDGADGVPGTQPIRIAAETCTVDMDDNDGMDEAYQCLLRTRCLTRLYEPLVKEYLPLSIDSLRRIVQLATRGVGAQYRLQVVHEVCEVKDEYVRWQSEGIFYYLCRNVTCRRILAPLCLQTAPELHECDRLQLAGERRAGFIARFRAARAALEQSLCFGVTARDYFASLKVLWQTRFGRLVLFDLRTTSWLNNVPSFLQQMQSSMRAAFTRLRAELYSRLEELFFQYVHDAKSVLLLDEAGVRASAFYRIFVATHVFLVRHMRDWIFANLDQLVDFFAQGSDKEGGGRLTRRRAEQHPLLQVELALNDSYQPRAGLLTRLIFGLNELLSELHHSANSFPRVEVTLLRTLTFKSNEPLHLLAEAELTPARESLMSNLGNVVRLVDELTDRYTPFCTLPAPQMRIAREGDTDAIASHVLSVRAAISQIRLCSTEVVFCGCVAVDCQPIRGQLCADWERYLARFAQELHKTAMLTIGRVEADFTRSQEALQARPASVDELNKLCEGIALARHLISDFRSQTCRELVNKIECMERVQIAIDADLATAVMRLVHWPDTLQEDIARAEEAKQQCRPALLQQMSLLRRDIRGDVQTLSTGITELYNMFNLDICDIAAQTCNELRELVTQITNLVDNLVRQEAILGVEAEDSFDDLYLMLTHFDTIEQYWMTVHRCGALQDYYATPIEAIQADKMISNVREWRRLLHMATRQLRAFGPLTRLGQQQETRLARFEALEDLLQLITTPGLRKHHWRDIARLLAAKLGGDVGAVVDRTISLRKLLDAGVMEHLPALRRIAAQARNDYDTETAVEKMKSEAKKSYFQLTTAPGEHLPRLIVRPECRRQIELQLESFVHGCQLLRRTCGSHSLMYKTLNEWSVLVEQARDMLIEWKTIEEMWGTMHTTLRTLQATLARNGNQRGIKAVIDKLTRASNSFAVMLEMLQKPQFSLYTAIVQDSITDLLLTARTAMEEAGELMDDLLEHKRTVFPRFNFVSDAQLRNFMSVYNTQQLTRLLPCMYMRLVSITVEEGAVVAFTAHHHATIRAVTPLPLTDEPTEEWMTRFDRTLAASLLAAIRRCVDRYAEEDLEPWLCGACPQVTDMALRVLHTQSLRDAMQLAGLDGLRAYLHKVQGLQDECRRIMATRFDKTQLRSSIPATTSLDEGRERVSSVMLQLQYIAHEVTTLIQQHVTTLADLDTTMAVQTFITDETIVTRCLGTNVPYGFEFVGHHPFPTFSIELVNCALSTFMLSAVTHYITILCGEPANQIVMDTIAYIFGRFLMRVQCTEWLEMAALRPILRGALECGILLCFQDCNAMPVVLKEAITHCLTGANEAIMADKDQRVATLPLGPGGAVVSIPVRSQLHVVFTCRTMGDLPRIFAAEYRPIQVPCMPFSAVVSSYLRAYCIPGVLPAHGMAASAASAAEAARQEQSVRVLSIAFGEMYTQFNLLKPHTFTDRGLRGLLRYVVHNYDGAPSLMTSIAFSPSSSPLHHYHHQQQQQQRHTRAPGTGEEAMTSAMHITRWLLRAFVIQFHSVLQAERKLQELLRWHIEHTLHCARFARAEDYKALFTPLLAPPDRSPAGSDARFARFCELMNGSVHAMLVGPPFAGKTKLWRRWVGQRPHSIICLSLLSAEHFYGTGTTQGLLSMLATRAAPDEEHVVVVEDGDKGHGISVCWRPFTRFVDTRCTFIAAPCMRFILTVNSLSHVTPSVTADVGLFYLPPCVEWTSYLRSCLQDSPHAELAGRLMAVLLPVVLQVLGEGDDGTGAVQTILHQRGPGAPTQTALHAASARCATLYRRWFAHLQRTRDKTERGGGGGGGPSHALDAHTEGVARGNEAATERNAADAPRMPGEEDDDALDEKTLAAQCAVQAVCWGTGLLLGPTQRCLLTTALRQASAAVVEVTDEFCLTERVLPPLPALPTSPSSQQRPSWPEPATASSSHEADETGQANDEGGGEADSVLDLVVTRAGWTRFDRLAAHDGLPPLRWSHYTQLNPQLHAWLQVFAAASRRPTLSAIECLLDCGQSVLLYGAKESGKSTLLQTTRCCDRWVSQLANGSRGVSLAAVQEGIASALTPRCDGRYGPSLGRTLVVCVDDVHLSSQLESGLPVAGRLMAFCEKFQVLCAPPHGYMPLADVVFLATALPQTFSATVTASCIGVYLPRFEGEELAEGIHQLFEIACARKRVSEMSSALSEFITLAHCAFVHLIEHTSLLLPSLPPPILVTPSFAANKGNADRASVDSAAPSAPSAQAAAAAASPQEQALALQEAEQMLPHYLHEALRASDYACQHLISTFSDLQVTVATFTGTYNLYASILQTSSPEQVGALRRQLTSAAEATLRRCVRDEVAFVTADGNEENEAEENKAQVAAAAANSSGTMAVAVPPPVSRRNMELVRDWIDSFDATTEELKEELLETMYKSADRTRSASTVAGPSSAAASRRESLYGAGNAGAMTAARAAESQRCVCKSVLLTYSSFTRLGSAALSRIGSMPRLLSRKASAVALQRRRSTLHRRSFRGSLAAAGGGGGGAMSLGSSLAALRPTRIVSKTHQTTWLTSHCVFLSRVMQHVERHVALISRTSYGVHRMLRLVCYAMQLPLVLFYQHDADYHYEAFRQELRAVIRYACDKDTRVVVYLPQRLLRLRGVARQVDVLMNTGDVSELFTKAECLALEKGFHVLLPQHTLRPAVATMTTSDSAELCRRVRRSLCFIIRVDTAAELGKLARLYPAITRMIARPLHSPESDAVLRRELVSAVFGEAGGGGGGGSGGNGVASAPFATDKSDDDEGDEEEDEDKEEAEGGNEEVLQQQQQQQTRRGGQQQQQRRRQRRRPRLSKEEVTELVCEMYDCVARDNFVQMEQLVEFAQQVKFLFGVQLRKVRERARHARVLLSRGDTAASEIGANSQRMKELAATLLAQRTTLAALNEKARLEETEKESTVNKALEAEMQLQLLRDQYAAQAAEANEGVTRADKLLREAAARLRKAPSSYLRSMATTRLPQKGNLLMRAMFRLLTECNKATQVTPAVAMPAANANATEVWAAGLKVMCAHGFPDSFAGLRPDMVPPSAADALCELHRELSGVRYGGVLPYAQLVADFIVAFVDAVRARAERDAAVAATAADERDALGGASARLAERQARAEQCRRVLEQTRADIAQLERECEGLAELQTDLAGREARLMRYVNMVDRFGPFLDAAAAELSRRYVRYAEGDALLVAAYSTLLAAHGDVSALLAPLQQLLLARDIAFSDSLDEAALRLLFPSHGRLINTLVAPALPLRHRLALLFTVARLPCRWQLFGAACNIFEQLMSELLSFEGTGCTVLSATDTGLREQLLLALKNGEGVLLRNVYNQATLDVIRPLCPLLALLNTQRARGDVQSSIPFRLYDKDVDVHPRFFLVCTSSTLIPDETTTASQWLNVTNLHGCIPRELRYDTFLLRAPFARNMSEEQYSDRKRFYADIHAFIASHESAASLLSMELDYFAVSGDGVLAELETLLGEVSQRDSQLAQLSMHMQVITKEQHTAYKPLELTLHRAAEVLQFIATEKLGQPWDERILDLFVSNVTMLTQELVSRLAPQSFATLPLPYKRFFALVNYMERVVRCLACGWPSVVRGTLAFVFLSGTVLEAEDVVANRGTLYAESTELLNAAQYKVLYEQLCGASAYHFDAFSHSKDNTNNDEEDDEDGPAAQEQRRRVQQSILHSYVASSDALLVQLAHNITGNEAGTLAEEMTSTTTPPFTWLLTNTSIVSNNNNNTVAGGAGGGGGDEAGNAAAVPLAAAQAIATAPRTANFFYAFAMLDFARVEALALALYNAFFADVKSSAFIDANQNHRLRCSPTTSNGTASTAATTPVTGTPSTNGVSLVVPPSALRRSTEHSTSNNNNNNAATVREPRGRNASLSTQSENVSVSTTIAASRSGGSSSSPYAVLSGQPGAGLQQPVHSLAELVQTSVEYCVPLFIVTDDVETVLRTLRQRTTAARWLFQWRPVRTAEEVDQFTVDVRDCFYAAVPPGRKGHWLVAHLDIDLGTEMQEWSSSRPAAELRRRRALRKMAWNLQRILAIYAGRRTTRAGRGSVTTTTTSLSSGGTRDGGGDGAAVALTLVCTYEVLHELWLERRDDITPGSYFYLCHTFLTAQTHLIELLTRRENILVASTLADTNRESAFMRERSTSVVGRQGRLSLRPTAIPTGRSLIDGSNAVDSVMMLRRLKDERAAPDSLERMAFLLAKELVVVHVIMLQRQRLRNEERNRHLRTSCRFDEDLSADDDKLIVLLHILRRWLAEKRASLGAVLQHHEQQQQQAQHHGSEESNARASAVERSHADTADTRDALVNSPMRLTRFASAAQRPSSCSSPASQEAPLAMTPTASATTVPILSVLAQESYRAGRPQRYAAWRLLAWQHEQQQQQQQQQRRKHETRTTSTNSVAAPPAQTTAASALPTTTTASQAANVNSNNNTTPTAAAALSIPLEKRLYDKEIAVQGSTMMNETPESIEARLCRTIFLTFQRIAYAIFAGYGLPEEECDFLRRVIHKLIVPPGATGYVDCDVAPMSAAGRRLTPQQHHHHHHLLLDADGTFQEMASELAAEGGDGVELCGDVAAVRASERRRRAKLLRMIFTIAEEDVGRPPVSSHTSFTGSRRSSTRRLLSSYTLGNGSHSNRDEDLSMSESNNSSSTRSSILLSEDENNNSHNSEDEDNMSSGSSHESSMMMMTMMSDGSSSNNNNNNDGDGDGDDDNEGSKQDMEHTVQNKSNDSDGSSNAMAAASTTRPLMIASNSATAHTDTVPPSIAPDFVAFASVSETSNGSSVWERRAGRTPTPTPRPHTTHERTSIPVPSPARASTLMRRPRGRTPLQRTAQLIWQLEVGALRELHHFYHANPTCPRGGEDDTATMGTVRVLSKLKASTNTTRSNSCSAGAPLPSLWLPALRHPLVSLFLLTRGLQMTWSAPPSPSDAAPAPNAADTTTATTATTSAIVCQGEAVYRVCLVITLERLLCPGDVVLTAARLSPLFQQEVQAVTGWRAGQFASARAQRGPDHSRSSASSASTPNDVNKENGEEDEGEDVACEGEKVVIAARTMRVPLAQEGEEEDIPSNNAMQSGMPGYDMDVPSHTFYLYDSETMETRTSSYDSSNNYNEGEGASVLPQSQADTATAELPARRAPRLVERALRLLSRPHSVAASHGSGSVAVSASEDRRRRTTGAASDASSGAALRGSFDASGNERPTPPVVRSSTARPTPPSAVLRGRKSASNDAGSPGRGEHGSALFVTAVELSENSANNNNNNREATGRQGSQCATQPRVRRRVYYFSSTRLPLLRRSRTLRRTEGGAAVAMGGPEPRNSTSCLSSDIGLSTVNATSLLQARRRKASITVVPPLMPMEESGYSAPLAPALQALDSFAGTVRTNTPFMTLYTDWDTVCHTHVCVISDEVVVVAEREGGSRVATRAASPSAAAAEPKEDDAAEEGAREAAVQPNLANNQPFPHSGFLGYYLYVA